AHGVFAGASGAAATLLGAAREGGVMSSFQAALDERIVELRQRLAAARDAQDQHEEEALLGHLETLIDIAGRSDVDTTEMEAVLAVETGALPIISAPGDSDR